VEVGRLLRVFRHAEAAGLAGVVVLWPPSRGITEASSARIRKGMDRAKVHAVIGLSPGNYSKDGLCLLTHRRVAEWGLEQMPLVVDEHDCDVWYDDRRMIGVWYGPEGTVLGCCLEEFGDPLWLRLWHRWFP
jgi:hypothetical protein